MKSNVTPRYDGEDKRVELEFQHRIVSVSKVDLDCYEVSTSDVVQIPKLASGKEDGGTKQSIRSGKKEETEQENKKHSDMEIKMRRRVMEEDNVLSMSANTILSISRGAPAATPANTPSKPDIPWLRTMSPSASADGRKRNSSRASSAANSTPP